ncbi:hypothetical protein BpHYR1_010865 [Brachionus plicatilis]|uniref:Uncharacterized protein n=1 Tax=Brachionus plicatilis TaxID=10195 RepID=A0A3M7RVB1_BRAPC|nr:hypothetical protein BpHYR1_010865 [Brachionus plicatilis]
MPSDIEYFIDAFSQGTILNQIFHLNFKFKKKKYFFVKKPLETKMTKEGLKKAVKMKQNFLSPESNC